MRIERAADRFLAQMQVERDATPETLRSYAWVLGKLCDRNPGLSLRDFEGRPGTDRLRELLAEWALLSAGTRGTRISVLRSFFDWLEQEELVDQNPARRLRRPPRKKIAIYCPTEEELLALRRAASVAEFERPAIVAMEGAGLRRGSVLSSRWGDWDLAQGRLRVRVKGGHVLWLPLDPDVTDEMRVCHLELEPEPSHAIFPAQTVRLYGTGRVRLTPDLERPGSPNALRRMLARVCTRAGVRPLHPHQLRRGFANRLDREGLDLRTVQFLMGHARAETTETYLQERKLAQAGDALQRVALARITGLQARNTGSNPAVEHSGFSEEEE